MVSCMVGEYFPGSVFGVSFTAAVVATTGTFDIVGDSYADAYGGMVSVSGGISGTIIFSCRFTMKANLLSASRSPVDSHSCVSIL